MRRLAWLPALIALVLDCGLPTGACVPACADGYVCSFEQCVPVHATTCVAGPPNEAFCQTFCDAVTAACATPGASVCGVMSCAALPLCRDACLRADAATATLYGCVAANGSCAAANACVRDCNLLGDAGGPDVAPTCGAIGLACCLNEACAEGAVCSLGRCYACGANGQVCCPGGACDVGHTCLGTSCIPSL